MTRLEAAALAFFNHIQAAAAASGGALPAPTRNAIALGVADARHTLWCNVTEGDVQILARLSGDGPDGGFELAAVHYVELMVVGDPTPAREILFDAAREVLRDALQAAGTLGGAVSQVEPGAPEREALLPPDGRECVQMRVPVLLALTAPSPLG